MTKVLLEVELDLETHFRRGRPARLSPPPGDPPEPEEIEVISLDSLVLAGHKVQLPLDVANDFLEEILAVSGIRDRIEDQVRHEASRG